MQRRKPKSKEVCGYTIAPVNAIVMLEAVNELEEVINELSETLFPTNSVADVISLFSADMKETIALIFRSCKKGIPRLMEWTATLSGVPLEDMRNDPAIGIAGVAELFAAVLEVNRIPDFFATALPAVQNVWQGIKSGAAGSAMESTKA